MELDAVRTALPENNESARLNARAPQGGEFFTVGLELVSTPLPACFRVLAPCPCQWRWNSVEISIRRGWAWSKPQTMYQAQPSKTRRSQGLLAAG